MVVPDTAMICENMLVSEGFTEAKLLARKFITLYNLCKELCSKQVSCYSKQVVQSYIKTDVKSSVYSYFIKTLPTNGENR